MNNIKIALCAFVCFLFTLTGIGQSTIDTIFFSQDEIVRKIHTTEKYIGIKVDNKKLHSGKGILYNRSGEIILEYEQDSNSLFDFIPNDRYNQIIVINKKQVNSIGMLDEIMAIGIDTKNIAWKTRSIASEYLISPDCKYLMTQTYETDADVKNEFRIINLMDGSNLPVNFDLGEYYFATWFDTQRVVLFTIEYEMKRNDSYFEEMEKYRKEISKIRNEKADFYFKYKNDSLISKQDFNIQNQKYLNKIDSIDKEYAPILKIQPNKVGETKPEQNIGRPYSFSTKSLIFIMYNIVTNNIEYEKKIDPGDSIIACIRYESIGSINIDEDKNIYVVDYKDKFYQLDKTFNINWSVKLEQPYSVYKVIDADSIFFVVEERKKNEYNIISKKGEKKLLNATDNPNLTEKIKKKSKSFIIDLRLGNEYDIENNLIKLRSK
jgi:hypothetical protein